MISTLMGLTYYRNIGKMANETFNVPNHLKQLGTGEIKVSYIFINYFFH